MNIQNPSADFAVNKLLTPEQAREFLRAADADKMLLLRVEREALEAVANRSKT